MATTNIIIVMQRSDSFRILKDPRPAYKGLTYTVKPPATGPYRERISERGMKASRTWFVSKWCKTRKLKANFVTTFAKGRAARAAAVAGVGRDMDDEGDDE